MQIEKIQKVPTYLVLAEKLAEQIMGGMIQRGAELPTEHELAERFGVNRSTVRESIRCLEQSGLVSRFGGKRLRVTRPSRRALASDVGRAMVLHETTFRDVFEIMLAFEPLAAQLATTRLTAAITKKIARNLKATKEAVGNPEELAKLDIQFHDLITEAAGNKALIVSREPLGLIFYSAYRRILDEVDVAAQRLLTAHRRIFDAMLEGDSATAHEWMIKHVHDFRRGYETCGHEIDAVISSSPNVISAIQRRHVENSAFDELA